MSSVELLCFVVLRYLLVKDHALCARYARDSKGVRGMKKSFNYDLAQKRVKLMIYVVVFLHKSIELYQQLSVVINYPRLAWGHSPAGLISSR